MQIFLGERHAKCLPELSQWGENTEKEQNLRCYFSKSTYDRIMILIIKSDLSDCLSRDQTFPLSYKSKNKKSKDLQLLNLKWLKVRGLLTLLMHKESQRRKWERERGLLRCKIKKEAHQWHLSLTQSPWCGRHWQWRGEFFFFFPACL